MTSLGTIFFTLAIICAGSWLFTAMFFRWMEKRHRESDTKIQIKIK